MEITFTEEEATFIKNMFGGLSVSMADPQAAKALATAQAILTKLGAFSTPVEDKVPEAPKK